MFSYNPHDPHFAMEPRTFSSHLEYVPFPPPSFINDQDNSLHDIFGTIPQPWDGPQVLPPSRETASSPVNGTGKRSARKDRHSKIVTAQGPRDRRMRLNREVAPQFFDIQDLLGYDKASKTVQWLLNEAKSSINKLKASNGPLATQSLSTEASSTEFECKSSASQQNIGPTVKKRVGRGPSIIRRSTNPSNPLTRESRAMARARARERTREKKNNNNLIFSSSIPVELTDKELVSHDLKSSLDLVADQMEERCSPSTNNGERTENELADSMLDHEQWASLFASIEDVQIQIRPW